MNKYTNQILKYLNKTSSEDNPIDVLKIFKKFNVDDATLTNILNILENKTLIKCYKHFDDNNQLSSVYYCSTTLGRAYFKTKFNQSFFKFCKYLITGIILPCTVAYFTSRFTKPNCEHCSYSDNCGQCDSVKP